MARLIAMCERLDNGLLLRLGAHTMLDHGYLDVDPRYRLVVSPQLREQFGKGEPFYALGGSDRPPAHAADRPA
jgi:putative restriction endonuclease